MQVLLVGPQCEENLTLGYLSSSLTAAGHQPVVAPFTSAADTGSVLSLLGRAGLVGLSMSFQVRAREYLELARRIKKARPGVLVVAGGHYASCAAADLLAHHPEIDAVVIYEGEQAIVEIADAGETFGRVWPDIAGLACRQGSEVVFTAPRPVEENLDSLPFPERTGPVHIPAGIPTSYILGSRGCLSSCSYCCITTLHRMAPGKRFRRRSAMNTAEEMAGLYHRRGIRQFVFHDDNFLVPDRERNLVRLEELRSALRAENVGPVSFSIKCRPADADAEVFSVMKEMGLIRVFFGIESGNTAGLASIGRRQSIDEADRALQLCRRLGISTQYTMMVFNPESTIETLRQDLEFMNRHINFPLNIVRVELYSGTPLEQRMIAAGRAFGDYLAREYRIEDPRIESLYQTARKLFFRRCWGEENLMNSTIRLDHLSELLVRYYPGRFAQEHSARVHEWLLEVNKDTLTLLERLIDIPDPDSSGELDRLFAAEAASFERLMSREVRLRGELEDYVYPRIGMEIDPDAGKIRRAPADPFRLVRHATAALLALSVAGGTAAVWANDPAAPPLTADTDNDGLCDPCEEEIFGTDYRSVDTDQDGIEDPAEDHDNDGIRNIDEQMQAINLHDALLMGSRGTVMSLIDYVEFIPVIDEGGHSALVVALASGSIDTVTAMVEHGVDVNDSGLYGPSPLAWVVSNGDRETLDLLLHAGADVNKRVGWNLSPLGTSVEKNELEFATVLVENGADILTVEFNGHSPLSYARGAEKQQIHQYFLTVLEELGVVLPVGMTPLMSAADEGNLDEVTRLVEDGAEIRVINNLGITAYGYANSAGHWEICQYLGSAMSE